MLHCPICKSTEVYTIVGGYAGNIYVCKRCGYRGALIVECDDEEQRDDR